MMELLKQDWLSIQMMPVYDFYSIIKQKIEFDKEVAKAKQEEMDKITQNTGTKLKQLPKI